MAHEVEGFDAPSPRGVPPCPGLSSTIAWDAPEVLRGELLTVERLELHAVDLAHVHGAPTMAAPRGALRQRFVTARESIHRAYGVLMQSASKRREMTPAEEWLIDNSHVVDDQLREIEEDLPAGYLSKLPRLAAGQMRGYPRVYALAIDFLRHTDARVDLESLTRVVHAYQTVAPLTIGELWAIPIMLRLGLLVNIGALAESEVSAMDRARGDEWAQRLLSATTGKHVAREIAALQGLDYRPTVAFLVHLLRRLREHDSPTHAAFEWVEAECLRHGHGPEELTRRHHVRQAADQLSVGNTITSMRAIGALDWNSFFERTSHVEEILRKDPAGAYARTDAATRDRYRHAVEDLARRSEATEAEVAARAVALARQEPTTSPRAAHRRHVGEFLVDRGRAELERAIGYRPRLGERLSRAIARRPGVFYFAGVAITTAVVVGGAVALAAPTSGLVVAALAVLLLVPASEIAVSVVNTLTTVVLPPRLLPKLDLRSGVPAELETLVVVPALLTSAEGVRELCADLEKRYLGNTDPALRFGLLTDFTDHVELDREDDGALLSEATRRIAELNDKYAGAGRAKFFLLHRRRRLNPTQGCAMGWERKRGKLEALNHLILGASGPAFDVMTVDASEFSAVRYVITLDADTELPHEAARRLIATIAHPLNAPVHDATSGIVVDGYAIVQPRVSASPSCTRTSRFARATAGLAGIDPYTTAVSDVYQDLFGEGSFVGKAIYDVKAFTRALAGRVPENALLSHDLFEGCFARSALATDIELFDTEPSSYGVAAKRLHRWIRGDWQLLPWLRRVVPLGADRSRNPVSLLGRWKVLDNLRRSLLAGATIALVAFSIPIGAPAATVAIAVVLGTHLVPLALRLLIAAARRPPPGAPTITRDLFGDLSRNGWQLALSLVFLLDRAVLAADAIARTLHRLFVSRRSLLEWQTMQQTTTSAARGFERRLVVEAVACVATLGALATLAPSTLPFAGPWLALFAAAPFFASWLSAPLSKSAHGGRALTTEEERELRVLALRTWKFFETFVTAADHWLPPDNWQAQPRGVVAHRTSPTNIGLYLLSTVAARDFGFASTSEVARRVEDTLDTIRRLDRHEGHVLNWYDTTTLRPLEPRYVSTVDSGNLAGYLWTLSRAALELKDLPIVDARTLVATSDVLGSMHHPSGASSRVRREIERLTSNHRGTGSLASGFGADLPSALDALIRLERALESKDAPSAPERKRRARDGRAADVPQALDLLRRARREVEALAPWAASIERAPRWSTHGRARQKLDELSAELRGARSPREIAAAARVALRKIPALRRAIDAEAETDDVHAGRRRAARARSWLRQLRAELRASRDACDALLASLGASSARALELADEMGFGFLFDKDRGLFSIGYNVGTARLDGSHYDLLASEARLASLIAIAKGDVPVEHWFKLGRPRTAPRTGPTLLSWSGSMFEYLMPLLVTRTFEHTLLDETVHSAVAGQIRYGEQHGVPWGVSEAAYNLMDLSLTYQYRAFGVPGFGLKAGLADDLVVAPYATLLAMLVRPDLAVKNLAALREEGVAGEFGYYESIDYSPTHVPPGRRGVVVKTFMAHHQGMGLVALDNALNGAPMQRRFHAEPRVQASELLLEERIPVGAPTVALRSVATQLPLTTEADMAHVEHVTLDQPGPLRAHLIGHGEVSSIVTVAGTGSLTWRGNDVHRAREGAVLERYGVFLYLRDLDSGEVWSAAHQPTCRAADRYHASMMPDRVEIHRRDGAIETTLEVSVSAEHPAEVRRLTITNHGSKARSIEVTSYTEVVLAPRDADLAHRAFSSMFVETESVTASETQGKDAGDAIVALFARRRPRGAGEAESWALQTLTPEEGDWGALEVESSRASFIGRGRDVASPHAMTTSGRLSGAVGTVLDPVFALRRSVRIAPRARARIALATAMAATREDALLLAETYGSPTSIGRTFQLGAADARVELRHLGLTGLRADRCQRLLSAILHPVPQLRATVDAESTRSRGRDALWALGISGDLPILLVRVDAPEFEELLRDVLQAHEFWRHNGVTVDLVLLDEEPPGYNQPQYERALAILRASSAAGRIDQRGGVFLRRAAQIAEESRAMLLGSARAVLSASRGSLARQLRFGAEKPSAATRGREKPALVAVPPSATHVGARRRAASRAFDNGTGGFEQDGKCYRLDVVGPRRPPAPWANVIANPEFGTVVTEAGAMFTWWGNSQAHRLTPWSNEPVSDPSGEVFLARDVDDGVIAPFAPASSDDHTPYVVEHGQGYTTFAHARRGLDHRMTVSVDPIDPVKIIHLHLQNRGSRPRSVQLLGVVEWVLGSTRDKTFLTVVTAADEAEGQPTVLLAQNPLSSFPTRCAFFATSSERASHSSDREAIFGRHGARLAPHCLFHDALTSRHGSRMDPAAALLGRVATISPGGELDVVFVLGEAEDRSAAVALARRYASPAAAKAALRRATAAWDELLGTVEVTTPARDLDVLANRWLLYQSLGSRVWARSAFYQSGGAFGFRDQLQDVMALFAARPGLAREHILRAARRQFAEGDVQHWWHPETGAGVRTTCSDDFLWLPYVAAAYATATGDRAIFDEPLPFLVERELRADEHDLFTSPSASPDAAPLYEHCVRALDRPKLGAHGLPLMGGGDWNDGMNRIGSEGRGESVWLAWFYARCLLDFAPIAAERGDLARADRCRSLAAEIGRSAEQHAWDGEWYRRAYFDDGTPVGSVSPPVSG